MADPIEYVLQHIKVATADVKLDRVFNALTPINIKELNNFTMYIEDIDFTLDLAGCIDKQEFINYLQYKHNVSINAGYTHKSIRDDDASTGKHCLALCLNSVETNNTLLRVKL